MVMVGGVRGHSSDFVFAWLLCRTVLSEELWLERNSVKFKGVSGDVSWSKCKGGPIKVVWGLRSWTGRDRELMHLIADRI